MKLNKSTTILLNIVLILGIVLLFKLLVSNPKEAVAQRMRAQTQVVRLSQEFVTRHNELKQNGENVLKKVTRIDENVEKILNRLPEPERIKKIEGIVLSIQTQLQKQKIQKPPIKR